jgi:predicted hydrolase (HD superfamily)
MAIEVAIKGLRIRAFATHLAREKPRTIEELYTEFEKYYRSGNDLRRRLEEQNHNK